MPTPDEELDQLLGGSAPAPQAAAPVADPDAELDALLASEPAAPPVEPAAPRQSRVIEMPTQHIEGAVPKDTRPWYSRLVGSAGDAVSSVLPRPNAKAALHGAASGATLNFGEEGASALSSGLSSVLPGVSDPVGYTREYQAGSQYDDMRNVLENENKTLREENPGSYIGGELLGSAPLAIAAGAGLSNSATPILRGALGLSKPAAAIAESAAVGGAFGGTAGAGVDTENRLRGAVEGAGSGALMGAALHGMGEGATDTAKNAINSSNRLITQTFMTPAQRAVYKQNHGLDALRKLGSDARDAGLFKGGIFPARAATVAKNASNVMTKAGGEITGFEDDLSKQGINPDIDIRPVVDELRSGARDYASTPALGAEQLSKPLNKQADLLELPESTSVPGKIEKPPALPDWSLSTTNKPKAGAAIQPVQESLPGTELPAIAADRPKPLPPVAEQLEFATPRAMPSKQVELNLPPRSRLAYSPEPTQLQMDLPRQQPGRQTDLGLEPMQAELRLPPAEARKNYGQPGAAAQPQSFAQDVFSAAGNPATGKFRDRRAYISEVYKQLVNEGKLDGVTLDGFKKQLLDAQKAGDIELTRADLVGAMDPDMVRNSKTSLDNSDFHFVNLDGRRPAAPATPQDVKSGGAIQEPLFAGTDPVRPPAAPAPKSDAQQLAMLLPDRQVPLPLEGGGRPNAFRPEARPAEQLNLPVQEALPLPAPAPKSAPEPAWQPGALEGQQKSLDSQYIDVARGPQPELSTPLPDAAAQISRENLPFNEAAKLKRLLGKQIDWQNNPRTQQSGNDLGTDQARKLTWKGVAQQIDKALSGDSRIDPKKLAGYNQAKKDFSVSATAFDPSVKMMEREGEVGLGARDLMAGAAFGGGNPIVGGLSSMAHKTGSGMMPSAGSAVLRGYAHSANALAPLLKKSATPMAVARQTAPEGAPEAEIQQLANDDVKRSLQELLESNK